MIFTKVRDLKYISEDKSFIDLLATCEEYGEIPMTLNIIDTEDYHTFLDGEKEVPLEEYCKKQNIAPYVIPMVKIPQSITARQFRLQLLKLKLLDEVKDFVLEDEYLSTEFEYSINFIYDSLFMNTLKDKLGLSNKEYDNLFLEASKL